MLELSLSSGILHLQCLPRLDDLTFHRVRNHHCNTLDEHVLARSTKGCAYMAGEAVAALDGELVSELGWSTEYSAAEKYSIDEVDRKEGHDVEHVDDSSETVSKRKDDWYW